MFSDHIADVEFLILRNIGTRKGHSMTDLSAELLLAEAEVPRPRTVSDVEKRPLRYSREVQGNVLAAFNKDHEGARRPARIR
jgi:hypothetical protein